MCMKNIKSNQVRPSPYIIMSYKEQCKQEGVKLVRLKIIRAILSGQSQIESASLWQCNKNTIGAIMKLYHALTEEKKQLIQKPSLTTTELAQFTELEYGSRAPHSHRRALSTEKEEVILRVHQKISFGPKRMYTHLKRQAEDMSVYTLAKIKGCYKRNNLAVTKVRTKNGERRPLYDYSKIAAFENLHYDVKHITDQHALPKEIYDLFVNHPDLPIYQWTIFDAKTRLRFLGYSHTTSSFFGQRFLLTTILWLRAHGIYTHIKVLFDGGAEFCSASERKLNDWQTFFSPYGVTVNQTRGDKVKQNNIERSHRSDDEEFYCPRGQFIKNKTDFLIEAQQWNIYWNNNRTHSGIGDVTPSEKLGSLGYTNALAIGRFPTFVLEDIHQELYQLPDVMETLMKERGVGEVGVYQNVLTYYL
jgi:putative transposase